MEGVLDSLLTYCPLSLKLLAMLLLYFLQLQRRFLLLFCQDSLPCAATPAGTDRGERRGPRELRGQHFPLPKGEGKGVVRRYSSSSRRGASDAACSFAAPRSILRFCLKSSDLACKSAALSCQGGSCTGHESACRSGRHKSPPDWMQ